ncbi:ATP-dependent DNA ligase [Candidatus Woesearchaeota archaeon]|nr:ATP-dependent DNA ligase [Candidatus Woesearchaeota archaeon]
MRYSTLVDCYCRLEKTPKRLAKVAVLARFLEETPADEIEQVILLLQGTVFPALEERKIGVAAKLVSRAIALATGRSNDEVEATWKQTGDLGDTAAQLVSTKKQQTLFAQRITVSKVFANIRKLAEIDGTGSTDTKGQYIAELLTSAEPAEACYIVRCVLGDMRVGAGEGLLRDALVFAYYPKLVQLTVECIVCHAQQPVLPQCVFCNGELVQTKKGRVASAESIVELPLSDIDMIDASTEKVARDIQNSFLSAVQEALDIFNDLPLVARRARMRTVHKLLDSGLVPGKPIKVMLFQKVTSPEEAFATVGTPAAVEFKYDGFRLQIHRNGDTLRLFTRRLEDVTAQFPDVVDIARSHIRSHDYIIDCEVVGFDAQKKQFTPFQDISQRIQRKYDVHTMKKEVPVQLIPFDVMELNGQTMLRVPFVERRTLLASVVHEEETLIELAKQLVTDKADEATEFYKLALGRGTEGVMVKSLTAPYKPGARVGYGVKIKPTMDTLDLVIVGGEWGEGKRASWLSSFTVACRSETGDYLEMGKVGTGFKEKGDGLSFSTLTEQLKPFLVKEERREVHIKPMLVLELAFEEIQRSPSYSSGFALRFPRLVRLRTDKAAQDCSPLSYVQRLYDEQN